MWTIFITQLFLGFLAISICYFVGKSIIRFYKITGVFFFRLFITYIIGIITIVFIYSMIKARGQTVNILLIPFIAFFLYFYRKAFVKKPSINWNEIGKDLAWSLGIFVLIFLYQSWFYFDFAHCEVKTLFTDFSDYAYFSNSLKLWGVENYFLTSMNYFYPEFRNVRLPYHYPELWLTAFWSISFKISTIKSYFLITYPILLSVYLIGICSLFENTIKKNVITICFSLLMLFITAIIFTFPAYLSILGQTGAKLAFEYIYILVSIILIIKGEKITGYIILICIPIFSIIFLPVIYGGILLYSIIIYPFQKFKLKKEEILILLMCILMLVIYPCYYYFISPNKIFIVDTFSILDNSIFNPLKKGISFNSLKITLINFIYYTFSSFKINALPLLLGIIPFILLTIKSQIKLYKLWILVLCMICCGVITSRLTSHNGPNSYQFVMSAGIFTLILTIIGISFFFQGINRKNRKKSFIIISTLVIIIAYFSILPILKDVNSYSYRFVDYSFYNKISGQVEVDKSVIMTFINADDYNLTYYRTISSDEIFYLTQISNKNIFFTLGNPELYLKRKKISIFETNFYNNLIPLNVWRSKGKDHTLLSFIKNYKIKYFYFKSGIKIPDFITHNAEKTITSSITHSTFIKIR